MNTYRIETIVRRPGMTADCYTDHYESFNEQGAIASYELDFGKFIGEVNRKFRKLVITEVPFYELNP